MCGCGCGQWAADAQNPALSEQWQIDDDVCYVRRAIDAWTKEAGDDASSAVLTVRLEAGDAADELDPMASAAAEIEALYRRHGLLPN